MKIGYLVGKCWYPPRAGSSIHVYQVARQLHLLGHEILSNQPGPEFVQFWEDPRLLAEQADILYIRSYFSHDLTDLTFQKNTGSRQMPVIWEINAPLEEALSSGISESEVKKRHLKRRLVSSMVDATVCNTPSLARYARERWAIENNFVIPLGSDPGMFFPDNKAECAFEIEDRFKVLWAGSEYGWQALEEIFRAAAIIEKKDASVIFVIVGKVDWQKYFDAKPANVIMVGKKPYREMPDLMASADLALCLYKNSDAGIPFYRSPLKLFDYMASGLPVVANDLPEFKQILGQEACGGLVEPTPSEIARTILRLRHDDAARAAMGRHGRLQVEHFYNWQRVGLETEEVITHCIGQLSGQAAEDKLLPELRRKAVMN